MDHEGLLRALFVSEPHLAVPALQRTDLRTKDLLRLMAENFEDIQKRNDAALLRNLPERSTLSVSRTMADIQVRKVKFSLLDAHTLQLADPQ